MRYAIYSNNTIINYIEADENFCNSYCAKHGYSYQESPLPTPPEPEPEPTLEERVSNLETAIERGLAL